MKTFSILIADDHSDVRHALRNLLSAFPHYEIVGEAVDGRDVISKAAVLEPDLILLDIAMPFINGLEAAHTILSRSPDVKILVVTSYTNDFAVSEARAIGVSGFISKGDVARDLMPAIEAIQSGRPFFPSPLLGAGEPVHS